MSAGQLNSSCMVFGEMSCMVGFTTGSSSGVSITPVLVSSFPILASRSLSRISKDIDAAAKTLISLGVS